MADPTLSGLTTFIQAHVCAGMMVIDVGANTGAVVAAATEAVGPFGRVIAYEPAPLTALKLRERFRDRKEVEVRQAALSDRVGRAPFYIDPSTSTSNTLYLAAIGPDHTVVDVPVRTLDAELPLLRRSI